MKPNTQVINAEGDLSGEKVQMGFDKNSLSHLMGLLTNLYSNPELAIVREYSTNALDSHKASGQTRPIEITTPNRLAPYFKVKDFGLGMNAEDIRVLYSQYGASTKRDSNDATGMMGIGSKSALTYTTQFNLIGIKDGIKTNVSISRTADGGGEMEIINESPTQLPNGVEIIIPSKMQQDFHNTCKNFFKYWDKDSVLIDGEPPTTASLIQIYDNLYVDDSKLVYNSDVVVMGGIPYELKHRLYASLRKPAVFFVPIGAVDFVPSREELHYTARTLAYIDQIKAETSSLVQKFIHEKVESAANESEALTAADSVSKLVDRNLLKWHGKFIPYAFECEGYRIWDETERSEKVATFSALDHVVVGFNLKQISRTHKIKIGLYREQQKIEGPSYFVVTESLPQNDWLKNFKVIQWDDINSIKIEAQPRQKRTPQPLEVYDFANRRYVSGIPAGKTLLYASKSDGWRRTHNQMSSYLQDAVLIEVQPRQIKGLLKKHSAVKYHDYIRSKIKDKIDNWPHPIPIKFDMDYKDEDWARGKSLRDYDDPDIKTLIVRYLDSQKQSNDPHARAYQILHDDATRWGVPIKTLAKSMTYPPVMSSRYPWVNSWMTTRSEIKVMNAYYWYYYAPNAPGKGK